MFSNVIADPTCCTYSHVCSLLSYINWYYFGSFPFFCLLSPRYKLAEPDLNEQALLMRALRDSNTPKIVAQDEVIFFGLMTDLFPGERVYYHSEWYMQFSETSTMKLEILHSDT